MLILTTGGTGFIGHELINRLLKLNHTVINLSRNPEAANSILPKEVLNISDLTKTDISAVDAIINLAGSPIDRYWTDSTRKKILSSRIETTAKIIEYIKKKSMTPKVFISGSAIGYYGPQHNDLLVHEESKPNGHFTHDLCLEWEKEAQKAQDYGVRVCQIRTGLVLSPKGGMLKKLLLPFKLGLGCCLGDGQQGFSWISLEDEVRAILHLLFREDLSGAFNLTAPNPVNNQIFSMKLAKSLNRPCILPAPAWLLKPLLGEMSDLLLTGQKVLPQRLIESGFEFMHPTLDEFNTHFFG